MPAGVAIALAVIVAVAGRPPRWHEAAAKIGVVTVESSAAARLPPGVTTSAAAEAAALQALTPRDSEVTTAIDELGGPTLITVAVKAGGRDKAAAALEAALASYRETRQAQIGELLATQQGALPARRGALQAELAQLDSQLGPNLGTSFDPLPDLGPQFVELAAAAAASQRNGLELVQLSSQRRLAAAELAAVDAQLARPLSAEAVTADVLSTPRYLEPRQRSGPGTVAPLAMGVLAVLATAVALMTDRRVPAPVRAGLVAAGGCGVLWVAAAGFQGFRLAADARAVSAGLDRLDTLSSFDSLNAATLEDSRAAFNQLSVDVERMDSRLGSPILAPLRFIPTVDDQVGAVRQLVSSGQLVVSSGQELLEASSPLVEGTDSGRSRDEVLSEASAAMRNARSALAAAEAPEADGLLPELQTQIVRYTDKRDRLQARLDTAGAAVDGLEGLLDGQKRYLFVAGNSAEARAGMGAFLSFAQIDISDGDFSVGDVAAIPEVAVATPVVRSFDAATAVVPEGAVRIDDADFERHFGHLEPDRVFSRLGLTPRFEASAPVAADLWEALGRPPVDGVVYLDSVGLASLLDVTGPIEIDGDSYDSSSLLRYLLAGQYDEFGRDSAPRRAKLDRITATVVAELGDSLDTAEALNVLRVASQRRNLMVWSRDEAVQRNLVRAGLAGNLDPTSLAVSVAAMNGKYAPYVDVRSTVVRECRGGAQWFTVRTTVRYNGISIRPDYVDDSASWAVPPRTYVGLAVVSLPGGASEVSVRGYAGATSAASGPDGASRIEAQWLSLQPGGEATSEVSFSVPAGAEVRWPAGADRGPINTVSLASGTPAGSCLAPA